MAFPDPPEKIVAFNSGPVAPHDIGRQFDEHRRGFAELINFLKSVIRSDGVVRREAMPAPAAGKQGGSKEPTLPVGVLGPNAGGFYAGDDKGATATSADYAQVAIDWAEHMPDTIPPNTLAINAITGDHWSSRWWANQSANAFGMLAWWYQGAWPSPGPPSTPNTPTGQPLPPGSMYFNTTTGQMMVWTGTAWVVATGPGTVLLGQGINDNRIINGDMRIDQRNNGASGTASGYTLDRWNYGATQASKGTWQRIGAAVSGFPYQFSFNSTSAYASAASDSFIFYQPIEADMISDFAWGTTSAQPVTLSFWVFSNTLSGVFSGSIRNGGTTRSYPFTFSLTAGAWTRITVAIPGDTAGTWTLSGNGVGLYLGFDLGSGSTYRGPANAWASADYRGVTGAVSVVGTNGAQFAITGVKLEVGSVATPFNRPSLARSMADCQRYYQFRSGHTVGGAAVNGTNINLPYSFPVVMRASPTLSVSITGGSGYTVGTPINVLPDGFTAVAVGTAASYLAAVSWTASAEL